MASESVTAPELTADGVAVESAHVHHGSGDLSATRDAPVGGQAVIEGVMMRAPGALTIVVRRQSDDGLIVRERSLPTAASGPWTWPLLRGVGVLVSSLKLGSQALRWSADLYETSGRLPFASINFVTAHDGFTLADLVSYDEKHNDANGEDGNDGESHNRSQNFGVEGPTDDPEVLRLRARTQRNLIATLLLSQGVPMLLHGDEGGRTQHGNNNTYC